MCNKGSTNRSPLTYKHNRANPYKREGNVKYRILISEDYVADFNPKKRKREFSHSN